MLGYLYSVGANSGILKQTIIWVEQLAGEKVKKFTLRSSVIQSVQLDMETMYTDTLKCINVLSIHNTLATR